MQRRRFMLGASATVVMPMLPAHVGVRGRTPGQILGPYYPVMKPRDQDTDLTAVNGRPGRATGPVFHVAGRVFDETGKPVSGAEIEIWQADANGHYAHPSDKSGGVHDPNFQGYAKFKCDAEGYYRFTTIKPGSYLDDGAGGVRAPHIHFQITGPANRLVTQMYFEGEALNDADRVLAFAQGNRERLISKASSARVTESVQAVEWDVVMRNR